MNKIVLASGSPRRKEILEQVGVPFAVIKSEVDEHITETDPAEIVMELSRQKAEDVWNGLKTDQVVLGADTVVAYEGNILGKPGSKEDAKNMLRMLSGKKHSVFTGVTMINKNKTESFYAETAVEFYDLTEEEIAEYVNSGEPMDKAGAYGIQGRAAAFIKGIEGDYYNVVGLPIAKVLKYLQKM